MSIKAATGNYTSGSNKKTLVKENTCRRKKYRDRKAKYITKTKVYLLQQREIKIKSKKLLNMNEKHVVH